MPTTPPGNATPCHEGDRRGGKGRPPPGGGPSLGAPRESATAGRERVFPGWASPSLSKTILARSTGFVWRDLGLPRVSVDKPLHNPVRYPRAPPNGSRSGVRPFLRRRAVRCLVCFGFSATEFLRNYGNYRNLITIITIILGCYFKDIRSWLRHW